MTTALRRTAMGLCTLAGLISGPAAIAQDATAAPTVIVDIHALGFASVEKLKHSPDVRWSAEFGNELLLGVDPASLRAWLGKPRVREGLGVIAPDEVAVRDHVCTHEAAQPALGRVGGYEILRQPPGVIRGLPSNSPYGALPEDGVYAREVANAAAPRSRRAPQPLPAGIVGAVDPDRWFATVEALAAINRNSLSASLPTAREYIFNQFGAAQLATEQFNFDFTGITACGSPPPTVALVNPIGRKVGNSLPDEWIVVGAHYDSRNSVRCDGVVNPQPGANDNASGCAGVIELARVFAGIQTARTILFMCFAGEEQGLIGSRRYVESLQQSGNLAKVKHMLNIDMMGFAVNDSLAARVDTIAAQQAVLADYIDAAQTYAPELSLITSTTASANSDHWYFLDAGIPGAFTWENGASIYAHYHQATDIPANMTRARAIGGGVLKMDAAVLAELAGAVASPEFRDGFE